MTGYLAEAGLLKPQLFENSLRVVKHPGAASAIMPPAP